MKQFLKNNIRWIISLTCILITIGIYAEVAKNGVWRFDYPIYQAVSSTQNQWLTTISWILAKLGGRAGLAILTISFTIALWFKYKNNKLCFLAFFNVAFIGALNFFIKNLIKRPRPEVPHLIDITGFSFPSGHAMGTISFWSLIIYLTFLKIHNKIIVYSIVAFSSLMIICTGISRIYLGVHYASDVICGHLITIPYLSILTRLIKSTEETQRT